MSEEKQNLNMESILRSVRLARPREADMSDFLSGIHKRIQRGVPSVGFPQSAAILLLVLICVGLVYLFLAQPERISVVRPVAPELLSIEEHMAILEALEIDAADEMTNFLGDDELLEELAFLDGMEVRFVGPGTGTEPH